MMKSEEKKKIEFQISIVEARIKDAKYSLEKLKHLVNKTNQQVTKSNLSTPKK